MNRSEPTDAGKSRDAQQGLHEAERGEVSSENKLRQVRQQDKQAEDAAEQEASDGPEGRGLTR